MKKNIKIQYAMILLLIIGIGFIINYSLFKPSEINFLIANRIYGSPANSAFTDERFYKCVVYAYNSENGTNLPYTTNLTDEQLKSIEKLICIGYDNHEIANVEGLNKLTSLTKLHLDQNKLTSLNLSNNQLLKELHVSDNNLTSLDISHNTLLEQLDVHQNKLTSLDVNNNLLLSNLDIHDNELTSLDISKNTALTDLRVSANQLTDIDVSHNTALTAFYAHNNQLTSLDVSKNILLTSLGVGTNQLTSLDISHNTALKYLDASGNQLTSLDISRNTSLENLSVYRNKLTSLDVSHNLKLKELRVYGNKLTSLNVGNNSSLKKILASNNQLSSLDVSHNPELTILEVNGNELTSLDLSNASLLEELNVSENQLTSLDLSNASLLKHLNVSENKLTSLDLSFNLALEKIWIYWNYLEKLDLSKNSNLTYYKIDDDYCADGVCHGLVILIYNDEYLALDDARLIKMIEAKGLNEELYSIEYDVIAPNGNVEKGRINYYLEKVSMSSNNNEFLINDEKNYIYTNINTNNDYIINNLIPSSSVYKKINNNKLILKYSKNIIKEFDLINISSDKYDLTKDYIFTFDENILSNINVLNGDKTIEDNKIQIKKGEDTLQEFDLVNATSDKYDLSLDKIKVQDINIESLISNINCTNCSVKIKNNDKYKTSGDFTDGDSLVIMYDNEILKEYELSYAVSGVGLNNNNFKLNLDKKNTFKLEATVLPSKSENKNISWESSNPSVASVDNNGNVTAHSLGNAIITVKTEEGEFTAECNVSVAEISTYTVTYPDNSTEEYEENERITFKSDLTKQGYELVGYKYNDNIYKLADELLMPSQDITLEAVWELVIPDTTNNNKYVVEDNYFKNISLNTDITNLDLGLDDIYTVKITKDNKEKTSGLIGTGDIINIYLDGTLVTNYTVIIKGDVTGNGKVLIGDVSRAYQYLKKKISMDDCFVKAADVGQVDGVIKVGDISKLYQYLKGKIKEL